MLMSLVLWLPGVPPRLWKCLIIAASQPALAFSSMQHFQEAYIFRHCCRGILYLQEWVQKQTFFLFLQMSVWWRHPRSQIFPMQAVMPGSKLQNPTNSEWTSVVLYIRSKRVKKKIVMWVMYVSACLLCAHAHVHIVIFQKEIITLFVCPCSWFKKGDCFFFLYYCQKQSLFRVLLGIKWSAHVTLEKPTNQSK